MFKKIFKKYKINAKKFGTVVFVSILEIVLILWLNNWMLTPALIPLIVQIALIFERKDIWGKMTRKEKEELFLSEEELKNFIQAVLKRKEEGKTVNEIILEIKSNPDNEN